MVEAADLRKTHAQWQVNILVLPRPPTPADQHWAPNTMRRTTTLALVAAHNRFNTSNLLFGASQFKYTPDPPANAHAHAHVPPNVCQATNVTYIDNLLVKSSSELRMSSPLSLAFAAAARLRFLARLRLACAARVARDLREPRDMV